MRLREAAAIIQLVRAGKGGSIESSVILRNKTVQHLILDLSKVQDLGSWDLVFLGNLSRTWRGLGRGGVLVLGANELVREKLIQRDFFAPHHFFATEDEAMVHCPVIPT